MNIFSIHEQSTVFKSEHPRAERLLPPSLRVTEVPVSFAGRSLGAGGREAWSGMSWLECWRNSVSDRTDDSCPFAGFLPVFPSTLQIQSLVQFCPKGPESQCVTSPCHVDPL